MAAAATWEPQEGPLRQLIECLDTSLSARDKTAQKNAEIMLKQAKASPDIDNYLCYLLANGVHPTARGIKPESIHTARSAAGIMLKNDIKTHYASIPSTSKDYIRSNIINGIRDQNVQIRNFSGNVVTELVKQAGVMSWPDMLPALSSIAGNDSGRETAQAQDGAMGALLKVCEDNRKALYAIYQSQRPLDYLVPVLIKCTSSPNAKVRANAVASLNVFIEDKPESLMRHFEDFLKRVFDLANDGSDEVKKRICTAVTAIAKIAPGKIAPHMKDLVSYMVAQQRNTNDPDLALEAAEFWLTVGDSTALRNTLGPFLPSVIPVLLECMIYSEDDVLRLESEAQDAEVEDREQDIKPQFAASKAARAIGHGAANTSGHNGDVVVEDSDGLSDGELEEYDDDDDADEYPEDQWNLRKCSAAALDVLASTFHQPVFETTLPYLKTNLTHEEWPNREAAVLAIGAIAEGCMDIVEPHLPDLIPFLITLLDDTEPIVRKITCWSLSRYSSWASHLDSAGKQQFFLPMMDGILKRMLDNDKRVQESAASAFATLEEKSNRELENPKYCEVIARQFAECFTRYKDRNMFILYDCVQTLAEHVGNTLQSPELVHYLMPALLKRWEKISDQSQEMFPLLECLSYIAGALGNTFSPYAQPIFGRCIRIIYQNLQEGINFLGNPALEEPNKDFLVTSLDLLSAVVQALGSQESSALISTTTPNLFDLLPLCLEDSSSGVKQSAYALLGDCAIYVFADLQPSLPRILPLLISQLDVSSASAETVENGYPVANNACWSCGEISVRAYSHMSLYVDTLLSNFFNILCDDSLPPSLHENAAIALGRLGLACPDMLGQHLSAIAPVFLRAMSSIAWTDEKVQAMKGISQVVLRNPQGLEQSLFEFITEISTTPAAWIQGTAEEFQKVLDLYKQHFAEFDSILQHLPTENQQSLRHTYNI